MPECGFSLIKVSKILSLYGKVQVRENLYQAYFTQRYELKLIMYPFKNWECYVYLNQFASLQYLSSYF